MFHDLLHDKYLRIVFGLSAAVLIAAILFLAIGLNRDASSFIIHFTSEGGVDLFGSRATVFGIPVAGLIVLALNIALADVCYRRNRFLSFLFGFISLGMAMLLFIAVSVIVGVN